MHQAGSVSGSSEPPTEGECWTRAELARLRDAGFRPLATLEFLLAAQTRAKLTRRGRPVLARQAATWMVAGALAWVLSARWLPGTPIARTRARGLLWWAGCALMLDWHLGMLETPEGAAVGLGAADALTLLRAWLAPAVAQRANPALVLVGALTDTADGPVARATRCTRLGRDLEGLVDACFAAAALRGAVRAGGLSPLPALLERARLLAGAGYVSTAYFARSRAPDRAVGRGERLAALVRMAGLTAAGLGRRERADRLLLSGTALAILCRLHRAGGRGAVPGGGRR